MDLVPEVPARLLQNDAAEQTGAAVPAASAVAATPEEAEGVEAVDAAATPSALQTAAPASGGAVPDFAAAATTPEAEPIVALPEVADSAAASPTAVAMADPAEPVMPAAVPAGITGEVFGLENADGRILLTATMESWVRVSDARDQPVWTRVLRSGQSYLVPNQPGLTLTTGNAGGLSVFVDGRKLPQLGPVGVVRRGISLEPDRLLGGSIAQ
jgi:cytoskeleton protein RodZ